MNSSNKQLTKLLSAVFVTLIYIFLYLPIAIIVFFSFNSSKLNIVFQGFTLQWYGVMLQNTDLMSALENTAIVASATVVISVFIGTLAAIGMFRYEFRGKSIVDSFLYIPIVIPEIVMGISLLAFYHILNISLGITTLIIAHVTFSMPYVVVTVRSRIAGYDMSVEEAAMDLGATRLRTLLRITLPIIAPGILAGAMLALTLSLDDVIVSFFTTGVDSMTLPIYIFNKVKTGVSPDINALVTVIILITLLILVFMRTFEAKTSKKGQVG
ncbi:ABC transporter permease [Desulfosporosinus sp. FKA]|uniref:ABC transporter permease n=1 Tax=Desulfosporosinus sp. FKA TaxID=1969834 RepID=UPI000B49BBB1|nr:ABC transporter permease [Desulfosporosinus sp. FKA]